MTCQVSLSLLLLALSTTFAAPTDYDSEQVFLPQKRAALVLDRLLVALSKALREEGRGDPADDGPRAAPLRVPIIEPNDMSALQRRGQAGASGRGRVLRCYFNAITCF